MKVMISYPPISKEKGWATLGQNRQFQYFHHPTYVYPVVPATAATLLKQNGFEVIWNDSIAEDWDYSQFIEFVKKEKPDLIAMETKTPVVKQHWEIINDLKSPITNHQSPITVLMGDHVTALPEESFQNSQVDFVLTGGDYDFLLLNLCKYLKAKKIRQLPITPEGPRGTSLRGKQSYGAGNHQLPELEPGIYYRENGEINPSTTLRIDGERSFDKLRVVPSDSSTRSGESRAESRGGVEGRSRTIKNTGKFQLNHDLDSLPFIDRDLTKWPLYAYKNGNYKRTPGTYIMSGRDCYWGRCKFCSWTTLYPRFRVRSVENVLDEIGHIVNNYPVKEIMDDTGSITPGQWLRDFCQGIIKRGYNKRIGLDCNMRFGVATFEDYQLMKKAGFRFLLFGLESANQRTLDRVNKNLTVDKIIESCKLARQAGLYPHITIMFGYPWESYEEALKTLKFGNWLLKKGFAYTMQATVVICYPGTPLFEECKEKVLLTTLDWSRYDMKEPVMKINFSKEKLMSLVQGMYGVSFNPEFIYRKLISIRDIDDIKYFLRGGAKVLGHLFDFSYSRNKGENI